MRATMEVADEAALQRWLCNKLDPMCAYNPSTHLNPRIERTALFNCPAIIFPALIKCSLAAVHVQRDEEPAVLADYVMTLLKRTSPRTSCSAAAHARGLFARARRAVCRPPRGGRGGSYLGDDELLPPDGGDDDLGIVEVEVGRVAASAIWRATMMTTRTTRTTIAGGGGVDKG